MFASKSLTLGQVNALVKKIGGVQTAKALLQGTVTFEIKQTEEPKDFTLWRTINIGGNTKEEIKKKLEDGGYRVSGRAWDMLDAPECTISQEPTEIDLVVVSVKELGLKDGATTKEIYVRAQELGLDLCPTEVVPQLRLQYPDHTFAKWLNIAMEPIQGSDGHRRIFAPIRDLDGVRYLNVNYGDPNCGWHSGQQFVFVRTR